MKIKYLGDIDLGECYSILFRLPIELLIKMMNAIRGMILAAIISAIGITMAKELYRAQGSSLQIIHLRNWDSFCLIDLRSLNINV